jgi:hypothetical protein
MWGITTLENLKELTKRCCKYKRIKTSSSDGILIAHFIGSDGTLIVRFRKKHIY